MEYNADKASLSFDLFVCMCSDYRDGFANNCKLVGECGCVYHGGEGVDEQLTGFRDQALYPGADAGDMNATHARGLGAESIVRSWSSKP